jgi:hypothetical protein
LCSNAAPLHRRRNVKGAEVYRCTVNLLLNPTNIMCVSSNDPDFIELEKLSKVLLLAGLIPPNKRPIIQRMVSKYTLRAKAKSSLDAARSLMSI